MKKVPSMNFVNEKIGETVCGISSQAVADTFNVFTISPYDVNSQFSAAFEQGVHSVGIYLESTEVVYATYNDDENVPFDTFSAKGKTFAVLPLDGNDLHGIQVEDPETGCRLVAVNELTLEKHSKVYKRWEVRLETLAGGKVCPVMEILFGVLVSSSRRKEKAI